MEAMTRKKAVELVRVYRDEALPQKERLAARDEVLMSVWPLIQLQARRLVREDLYPDYRNIRKDLSSIGYLRCCEFFGSYKPGKSRKKDGKVRVGQKPSAYFGKVAYWSMRDHLATRLGPVTLPWVLARNPERKRRQTLSLDMDYDNSGKKMLEVADPYAEGDEDELLTKEMLEAELMMCKLRSSRPEWAQILDLHCHGLCDKEIVTHLKKRMSRQRIRQLRHMAVKQIRRWMKAREEGSLFA